MAKSKSIVMNDPLGKLPYYNAETHRVGGVITPKSVPAKTSGKRSFGSIVGCTAGVVTFVVAAGLVVNWAHNSGKLIDRAFTKPNAMKVCAAKQIDSDYPHMRRELQNSGFEITGNTSCPGTGPITYSLTPQGLRAWPRVTTRLLRHQS